MTDSATPFRTRGRPAARHPTHPQLHQTCRRQRAGGMRRYQGAVHRQRAGKSAAACARHRRRLADRRIRHVAARHAHPRRPRSRARQAIRPHPGNPASDRTQPARRRRSGKTRRAHASCRLRRAAGRWRHPHRQHHRRLGGGAGRHQLAGRAGQTAGQRDARPCRRHLGRRLARHAGARSGLRRRRGLRHRHERGDAGRRRFDRGAGHGRRRGFLARRTECAARSGRERHPRIDGRAKRRTGVLR